MMIITNNCIKHWINHYKLFCQYTVAMNNENSQKWWLCYDVDFSKKCGRPGGKGSENADKGEGV